MARAGARVKAPLLSSSSSERSETGGPSGAEGERSSRTDWTDVSATGSRSRAPLGSGSSLRFARNDESYLR